MDWSLQFRDVLQSLSVLIAAGSVAFAVMTYKRSRITQQITTLRSALGDSRRKVNTLNNLLSESGACQVGVSISEQLKTMFGNDLSPEDLGNSISDEENKNIIITAIHDGFSKTSVSTEIEQAVDKFSDVDVILRTIAPNTSFIISSGSRLLEDILKLAYATGHLKQVFDAGHNVKLTADSIKTKQNIHLAYADLADSISVIPITMMKERLREVFSQARKLIEIPSDKLMSMTDDELRKFSADDKKITPAQRDFGDIKSTVITASAVLGGVGGLFKENERDEMIKAVAQLDVMIKGMIKRENST